MKRINLIDVDFFEFLLDENITNLDYIRATRKAWLRAKGESPYIEITDAELIEYQKILLKFCE